MHLADGHLAQIPHRPSGRSIALLYKEKSKNYERCQGNDGIDYRTFKEYKARNHASARIICKTHPRPLNKNSTFMFDSVFTTLSSAIQSNFNQSNHFFLNIFIFRLINSNEMEQLPVEMQQIGKEMESVQMEVEKKLRPMIRDQFM